MDALFDVTHNERIAQLHRVLKQLKRTQAVVAAVEERQKHMRREPDRTESEARIKYIEMNLTKATEKLKAISDLMDRQQRARGQ